MSQKLKVSDLVPHKDNNYFFDDIEGDAWQAFLESIKTSGVIEPIIVTQNKIIVSGHQRVKACKTLGIDEIEAEVKIFDSENEILKCLIDTNIRQRGIGNPNPVKFGRCIRELEKIAGVKNGGDRKSEAQNELLIPTQEQLAESYGISLSQWKRYKEIGNYIPEIQDLLETKIVTPSVARAIVKKLPEFQQKELAKQLAEEGENVTGKEVEKKIKELEDSLKDMQEERDYYQYQLEEEQNKEPEKIEVFPEDYDSLKEKIKELEALTESLNYQELEEKETYPDDYMETVEELKTLKQQMVTNAKTELADFVKKYSDYLDVRTLLKKMLKSI